ncbi:hypothetical protein [Nocardiopsis dassonvillei]|uniref:hypothetical protein n=1 Tax=Nocardiopsis dassonvillei TaxID=2014 RepID=UPI00362FEB42
MIAALYLHMAELFAQLPLRVELPEFHLGDPDAKPESILLSLQRARDLLAEEPISAAYERAYDKLSIEWFTLYELMALSVAAGATPWRLAGIEEGITRFGIVAEMIESGELDGLDDE